ncbi:hypothetical protein [Fulvivirga lutimaris]|uniref:hypothetical protein n=1 Tax=Fulvivirga lutimaris TaxID=1819566 RepID=UPI0012BB8708|nr:hypothetical protein [Fulvivirga lutimaris]MTI39757.1 hypothetical protein [Fulvivirga lutimaris]
MTLSPLQVDLIKGDIRQNGIELSELQDDLLDHICCILEYEGNEASPFDEVYERVKRQFFPDGYREIQEQTNYLITQKYNTMKKVMNVIGIGSSAVLMLGSIMKIQSLPASNELILLGAIGLTLGYLPMLLILTLKQSDMLLSKIRNVSGFFGAEAFIVGVLFQVLHLPGGQELLFLGMGIVLMIFLPLLFKSAGADALTKLQPATISVLLLAIVSTFFAFSNKKTTHGYRDSLLAVNANLEASISSKMTRLTTIRKGSNQTALNTSSQDVINYIDGLKTYIILQVDPASESKKLDNSNVIVQGDNLRDVMIENRANHQFNGQELIDKLSNFNKELKAVDPQMQSPLLAIKNENTWLNEKFNNAYDTNGLYSIYCLLSQIQLEVTSLEIEALSQHN